MEDRRILEGHDGDLKGQAERIGQEFLQGFLAVERIGGPAITVFGSARVTEDDPVYAQARDIARRIAEAGFAVVTGGGPGVMEAANRGARDARRRLGRLQHRPARTSSSRTPTSTSA
jgi:hypothetical protein